MTYKTVINMCMLFIVLPVWIGIFWIHLLKSQGKLERLLNAWILGLVTMLGVGQIILVPMIAASRTLTGAVMVFKMILTVLAMISFYIVLKSIRETGLLSDGKQETETAKVKTVSRPGTWTVVLGVLAAVLILIQALIPVKYQHIDDDDSRFLAEAVSAVVHDTMLKDDPITVDFMYWDLGEVRKDLTSPWMMYVSICSRISDIHPAVFSHTLFPLFMIVICYVVYGMIGRVLLKNDMEKVFLFLIFLSVIHIWGYTSTHTMASMLLLRIWQGKAVVASFIVPLLFYLMYHILREQKAAGYIAALYAVSFAGSLLSGIGIVLVAAMIAIYGLADFAYHRKWKKTLGIWLSAAPCGIYLGYYLMGLL